MLSVKTTTFIGQRMPKLARFASFKLSHEINLQNNSHILPFPNRPFVQFLPSRSDRPLWQPRELGFNNFP